MKRSRFSLLLRRARLVLAVLALTPCVVATAHAETRVYVLNRCPSDTTVRAEAAGGLLAAVLPALVDKAIGLTASAIRKASEASSKTVGAERNKHFLQGNPSTGAFHLAADLRCLVLVDGEFGSGVQPAAVGPPPQTAKGKILAYLQGRKNLEGEPRLYFEAELTRSDDNTAFDVSPVFLHYPKRLGKKISWGRKYETVFNLMFYPPAGEDASKSFATGILAMGDVIGTKWSSYESLPEVSTRWMAFPALTTQAKAAIADIQAVRAQGQTTKEEIEDLEIRLEDATGDAKKELETKIALAKRKQERVDARIAALAGKHATALTSFLPYTLRFELVETRKASKFLAAVADILDTAKDPAKEAVAKALDPGDPEAETQAQEEADLAAVRARHAVESATLELELVDRADARALQTAEQSLAQRKLEANAAYRKAGWPVPYPAALP